MKIKFSSKRFENGKAIEVENTSQVTYITETRIHKGDVLAGRYVVGGVIYLWKCDAVENTPIGIARKDMKAHAIASREDIEFYRP